jgi:hypothetical protein
MACLPCQQQRRAFLTAARKFDVRGAAQAVATGVAINVDKMRGVDVAKKYGQPVTNTAKATPYRRPIDRSV